MLIGIIGFYHFIPLSHDFNPYSPGYSYVSSANRDPDTRLRLDHPLGYACVSSLITVVIDRRACISVTYLLHVNCVIRNYDLWTSSDGNSYQNERTKKKSSMFVWTQRISATRQRWQASETRRHEEPLQNKSASFLRIFSWSQWLEIVRNVSFYTRLEDRYKFWWCFWINPYSPGYSYLSSANRDPDTRTWVGGPSTGIRVHE